MRSSCHFRPAFDARRRYANRIDGVAGQLALRLFQVPAVEKHGSTYQKKPSHPRVTAVATAFATKHVLATKEPPRC